MATAQRPAADSSARPRFADADRRSIARRLNIRRSIGSRDWLFGGASLLVAVWAAYQNFAKLGTAPIIADEPTYIDAGWRYVHGQVSPPGRYVDLAHAAAGNFEHPPLAKYLFGLA